MVMTSAAGSRPFLFSKGVWFMLAGVFMFSLGTACIKMGGERLPPTELLMARVVAGFLVCQALLRRAGAGTWGNRKGLLLLRGVTGTAALLCIFQAFIFLPLADATVLFFLHPVFVALLSAWLLGERMGKKGVLSVFLSLLGVVFIIKPSFLFGHGHSLDPFYVAVALAAAVFAGATLTTVKVLTRTEHPLVIVMYQSLVAIPVCLALGFEDWLWPTPVEMLLLLGLAGGMNLGQYFMTRSFALEEAGRASAVGYMEIVFAAGWGVLFFSEYPDVAAALGALCVVSGTFLLGGKKFEKRRGG